MLLDEVLGLLDPAAGETYVDATAGLGGHAAAVAPRLGPAGTVILNDLDPSNLRHAEARVRAACEQSAVNPPTVHTLHGSFADLPHQMRDRGLAADMLLADLGFSSNQVDDASRGLSFSRDGPLDMRLDPDGPITAADLINESPETELAELIYRFGEERHARRIARKVVAARRAGPISTTAELATIVRAACPPSRGPNQIDPATRTFQALRIAVNDEIGHIEALLAAVGRQARSRDAREGAWLRQGARVVIIAFHSLEDRPVKHTFAELAREELVEPLTRKPVRPGEAETRSNPRARSARARGVRVR